MIICETERQRLRWLTLDDAPFICELLNDPTWLRYLGDRNIRDLDDAREFITSRFLKSYETSGHGLFLTERLTDGVAIGINGIVSRPGLEGPDVGFALLPAYRKMGYAYEASLASLDFARDELGLASILAVTAVDNFTSSTLLEKLGLQFTGLLTLPDYEKELRLYEGPLT